MPDAKWMFFKSRKESSWVSCLIYTGKTGGGRGRKYPSILNSPHWLKYFILNHCYNLLGLMGFIVNPEISKRCGHLHGHIVFQWRVLNERNSSISLWFFSFKKEKTSTMTGFALPGLDLLWAHFEYDSTSIRIFSAHFAECRMQLFLPVLSWSYEPCQHFAFCEVR